MFHTKLYDKRDDFSFDIVNFPNLSGHLLNKSSYGIFISQLIRFSIACVAYADFINISRALIMKLINQHYDGSTLKRTFMKFSRR